jgi:hypothetical protein
MTVMRVLQVAILGTSILAYGESTPLADPAKKEAVLVDLGFRGDLSCLKDGKTLLASSISLAEAKAIQKFIKGLDGRPIFVIERRPTESAPQEIFIGTGAGCRKGNVGGGGSFFTIAPDPKGWRVVRRSEWVS